MPLMKRKSQKAFEHNLKAEMHAGKPQPQALAIAYSVKRRAKKASGGTVESGSKDMNMADGGTSKQGEHIRKSNSMDKSEAGKTASRIQSLGAKYEAHARAMKEGTIRPKLQGLAEGGEVSISAKSEKRPMPNDTHGDSDETRRNSSNKRPGQDSWTDRPTVAQARKPSLTRLSEPKMVESGVIRTKIRRDEHDLMDMGAPARYDAQPSPDFDEEDAKKEGKGPDMAKPHTTRSAYAEGGSVRSGKTRQQNEKGVHTESFSHDKPGKSDSGVYIRSHGSTSPKSKQLLRAEHEDIMSQQKAINPKLKGMSEGGHVELEYGAGPEEDEHTEDSPLDGLDDEETQPVDEFMSTNRMAPMLADGGHIEEDQDNYEDDGHEDSIAAAIMARRDRLHDEIDSGAHDLDAAAMYADGGEVDLSINADEEPNNEDQMSFEALKKENYSESDGLDDLGDQPEDSNTQGDEREEGEENKYDRVSSIMSRMNSKKQFKR